MNTEDLKEVLVRLSSAQQTELLNKTEGELEDYWHFTYNSNHSTVHNLYEFYSLLELYHNFCERWEEAKNGSCCVVERVRDKYLMPKIKQFVEDLKIAIQKKEQYPR